MSTQGQHNHDALGRERDSNNSEDIRDRGIRLTPQRELVLQVVRELGHSTPEQITNKINELHRGVNASTIYRNLEILESANLVEHTHVGHGPLIYSPVEALDHFHLTCGQCGSRIDSGVEFAKEFVDSLRQKFDFEADITHFPIDGLCTNCR